MPPETKIEQKVRQQLDFEQLIFLHWDRMSAVQAERDMPQYESMLNSLVYKLFVYWPDTFKGEWDALKTKVNKDDPTDPVNYERLVEKEILLSRLMENMGILFTKKKKLVFKGDTERLWKIYPPLLLNKNKG
jgi:hypothetical protein